MRKRHEIYEAECVVCGKKIGMLFPEDWVYKAPVPKDAAPRFCCSWHCYRQMPDKPQRGKRKGCRDSVFALLGQNLSDSEIASIAGVSIRTVKYWKERYTGVATCK